MEFETLEQLKEKHGHAVDYSGQPTFTARLSSRGHVAFPAWIRKLLNMQPGSKLIFHTDEDGDFQVSVLRPDRSK